MVGSTNTPSNGTGRGEEGINPVLSYRRIRPDIIEAIDRWAAVGCPTGSFVQAVLENNLSNAVGFADKDNLETLPAIVNYVYNEIPGDSWGSPEKVAAWRKKKVEERAKLEAGE